MFGKRCDGCGEVRWSILGRSTSDMQCPNCGDVMVDERRRPGRGRETAAEPPVERRDAPEAAGRTAVSG